jgi:protein dpy-30
MPQTESKPEADATPPTQPVSTPPDAEDVNMTDVSEKENKTADTAVPPATEPVKTEEVNGPPTGAEATTTEPANVANDVKPDADEVKVVKADDVTEGTCTSLSGEVQKIIANEIDQQQPTTKKSRLDLQSLPTRQYLDQTVVPILLQGLAALSKERPPSPIEYLSAYLLKHKSKFEG